MFASLAIPAISAPLEVHQKYSLEITEREARNKNDCGKHPIGFILKRHGGDVDDSLHRMGFIQSNYYTGRGTGAGAHLDKDSCSCSQPPRHTAFSWSPHLST